MLDNDGSIYQKHRSVDPKWSKSLVCWIMMDPKEIEQKKEKPASKSLVCWIMMDHLLFSLLLGAIASKSLVCWIMMDQKDLLRGQ